MTSGERATFATGFHSFLIKVEKLIIKGSIHYLVGFSFTAGYCKVSNNLLIRTVHCSILIIDKFFPYFNSQKTDKFANQ